MQKSTQRLQKEYEKITKNPPKGVKISSSDVSTSWTITLAGPENSPYEKGNFILACKFDNYPFKPPKIVFNTKIYHPNVNKETGEICKDIYEENWAPTKTVENVLDVIKSMLAAPNTDTPVEVEIAAEYNKNRSKFDSNVKAWIKEHCK